MNQLMTIIVQTAEYYSKQISEGVLKMYIEDLEDLDPEKCIEAYRNWRKNPKNQFFPLPAQIREIVQPDEFVSPEIEAREVASRIVGAISRFGWNNARDAKRSSGRLVGALLIAQAGGVLFASK